MELTDLKDYDGKFELVAPWPTSGDQPEAIDKICRAFEAGEKKTDPTMQTLLGVTGSGKTFTMANIVARLQRPTLVMAPNKTLAAQLYSEFKDFFPNNAVHYFVSYYDYYQPEAYVAAQDIYIEKDASINERIEKLRLATTKALIERRDVIVVASVSCIYGLGKRKNYEDAIFRFAVGDLWRRRDFMMRLLDNYYERNDTAFAPGVFRVRGDVLELYPSYSDTALRISFFDDEIERIDEIDPVSGKSLLSKRTASIYPAKHYVTSADAIATARESIERELSDCLAGLREKEMLLEAQRLESRTKYDLEMLTEVGYCSGIENYSRHLDGRAPGETPGTLMDFFPDDFLLFLDESHMTVPQIRGMFNGDKARKEVLVEYGFRLPSCLDNRPLKWDEFETFMKNVLFVSATPGDYELERSSVVAEQLIRPTGVPDPEVEVHPATGQVDHLLAELRAVVEAGERALVTTLTKRSAEDLAKYYAELGLKVQYLHSEMDTFERAEILRDLRLGVYSVLIGVNLLREGIDLPEVSLVAITEADREGYLRSYRSLIQMIGRAARNEAGRVILYADKMTHSIDLAIRETMRRRNAQIQYNEEHGIVPQTITKAVKSLLPEELMEPSADGTITVAADGETPRAYTRSDVRDLERRMWEAVERLEFEQAAELRDLINNIKSNGTDKGGFAGGGMDKNYRRPSAQFKKHRRRAAKR
ncbi:excinuclease ABC subunit UvrB [Synergistaceae bacterium OttesenSCG-928-I11]|nr:excinuclease ABC subunit UvrB [Synergistaceae bacterium OttesenSCG-928-I11]